MRVGRIAILAAIVMGLGLSSLEAQLFEDFEGHAASGAGVPTAGQNGWYVPAVASTLDTNAYTYAGNGLLLPPHPTGGGLNFDGGTNTGGAANLRTQHVLGIPPYTGVWSAQFDICVDYLGPTFPAVQNIGSFSLQPSTTNKSFVALATWSTPIPAAGPPTGWTLDWIFFDAATGLTQIQATTGNAALGYPAGGTAIPDCFKNLRLRNWYRVKAWWDWGTNALMRISIKDLSGGWLGAINLPQTGVPQWCLYGGLNNVAAAPDPTDVRFFVGGTTYGNTAGYDNLLVAPDVLPPTGNEYQVNQPGIATATLNGVQGTTLCPAVTTSSFAGGTVLTLAMDGGAPYDLVINYGPIHPVSGGTAIVLSDGQIFNLNLATVSFLCPGGPNPCLVGPVTITLGAPPPGLVATGQVAVFGVGPLGISLSQPFTLITLP